MDNQRVLAVIDVQNVFLNDENSFLAEKIRYFIEEKGDFFHSIIFFRFVNHPRSNFVKYLSYDKAFLPEEIKIAESLSFIASRIFDRTTFSIFTNQFKEYVNTLSNPEIFLSGLDSDACVMASAYHGFDLGYKVRIIEDLIYSKNSEYNKISLKIMGRNLPSLLIKSKDIP